MDSQVALDQSFTGFGEIPFPIEFLENGGLAHNNTELPVPVPENGRGFLANSGELATDLYDDRIFLAGGGELRTNLDDLFGGIDDAQLAAVSDEKLVQDAIAVAHAPVEEGRAAASKNPLAAKRIDDHINQRKNGTSRTKSGLDRGFAGRIDKLADPNSRVSKTHRRNVNSVRSGISRYHERVGILAADLQEAGASMAVFVTTAGHNGKSGRAYSLGSGVYDKALDLTIEEAIKLTSRPSKPRKDAAKNITLRAILEAVEAAVSRADVVPEQQVVDMQAPPPPPPPPQEVEE